jgi:hypothetical protein
MSFDQRRRSAQIGNRRLILVAAVMAVALGPTSRAEAQTTTQTLSAVVSPMSGLFTVTSSVTLIKAGSVFTNYVTSTPVAIQYRTRTTVSTGSATITVKATSDFPCASGGPCIATPPSAGDALTYTCSGATQGTGCSGSPTVSTTSSTTVLNVPASSCTGGGGSCSTADPNTINVAFQLTNDPKYRSGSYSATLTFTISAS